MALGYQVKLRFIIDQKDSLNNMIYLKDVFNLFLIHRKLTKKIKIGYMHRIETNSFVKIPLIIKYLDEFNLKTKKKESYYKWKKVYNMILDKKHLNKEGLDNIKNLSKKVNLITSVTKKISNK